MKKHLFLTIFFWILVLNNHLYICLAQKNKSCEATGAKLRAAVVKKNITPSTSRVLYGYDYRNSTGIHDSIFHRIIILDDGEKQFILVSTDICEFSPSQYDKVSARLKQELGIERTNFWWAATHTHSAPELGPPGLEEVFFGIDTLHHFDKDFQALVEKALLDGIRQGLQNLTPVTPGIGWGTSRANINRRAKEPDGRVTLGMNPDGATDQRIGLLRLDRENGTPLALIANYPLHGTVLGEENSLISGDVMGVVSDYVEKKTGAPLIFINGAMGNLSPIYSFYPDAESGHLSQFCVLLGDKILEANKTISYLSGKLKLHIGELILETPRKPGIEWASDLSDYSFINAVGRKMIKLPLRFLIINDELAIWGAPLELFCEISNEIREKSPYPYTFYFGLINGFMGYMLPEKEYFLGGYEHDCTPYIPSAPADLIETVSNYLMKIKLKSVAKH